MYDFVKDMGKKIILENWKSLAISKLIYVASILPIPEDDLIKKDTKLHV